VLEYAAGTRPDCVLICYNPVSVSNKSAFWFDFGRLKSVPDLSRAEKVACGLEVKVSGGASEWANKRLSAGLVADSWYRVSFRMDASPDVVGATVGVYDDKLRRCTNASIFPNEGPGELNEWVFRTGANPAKLALYAGVAGKTAGKSVRYSDVCVEKVAAD